ncbi:MAG: PorV/PorQ family protein [Calditrichae bacterium]|nr:PorV/PorQ family protein [Calditrichia bacterium]
MPKKMIFLALLLLFCSNSWASSFKKYAGEFLYLGAGSRGTAMGGAFSALANDVSAIYWNPAGLMEANGLQLQFMHSKQFISSIQNSFLSASTPLTENSAIAASLYYLTVNDIKDSRNALVNNRVDPALVKLFNTGDYIFTLAYAEKYNQDLDWGVNVKFIYRDFELESATGIGFDAGLKYTMNNLRFGLVLRDFTSTLIAWSTNEKQFITPSMRLGSAFSFFIPAADLAITPTIDVNLLAENREYSSQFSIGPLSADLMAGMEISYDEMLALRLGIDDIQRFNAGIGISLPRVTLDYAFTEYGNELGNIHRISLHIFFNNIF